MPLERPLCDRAELPEGLRWVRTSAVWDEETMPAGLRRAHRVTARGAGDAVPAAILDDDFTIAPVDAGQGVGLLTEIRPAHEVVERLSAGADQLLRSR